MSDLGATPHRRWVPVVVLLVGLVLSVVAAQWQSRKNDVRVRMAMQTAADGMAEQLLERLQLYEYGLRGARGVLLTAGIDRIDRQTFRQYHESRDIEHEFPGARGFGFIRRVPVNGESAFLAQLRRDASADIGIRQLEPHGGDRYVIQNIEPIERNVAAVGLDIASEANRRAAADEAARTGRAVITRPITLVQAPGQSQRSFLLLLPVYRPGLPLVSLQDRQAALVGWTYAPLLIDEVLRDVDLSQARFALALDELTDRTERFFESQAQQGPFAPPVAGASLQIERHVYGRLWRLSLQPRPLFYAQLHLLAPGSVFATGLLVTLLSSALLLVYQSAHRRRVEMLAGQQRLAALTEQASDAIVVENIDGVVTSWNRAAERLFGWSAGEAIGRHGTDLLLPPAGQAADEALRARVIAGETPEPVESVGLHRHGRPLALSMGVSTILSPDGRVVGVGRLIRDIHAEKEAALSREQFTHRLEIEVGERTAALELARRDMRTVLDALPSMVGYWDRDMRNRFANHAYARWFGVEPSTMPGKHLRDLLGDSLFEMNRPRAEAALRGEPQTFERAVPRPDGSGYRQSLFHYLPDVIDGEVRGFYVLVHEVTEIHEGRRKLADALREIAILLNTVRVHALFSQIDLQGHVIEINDRYCELSGYEREELLAKGFSLLNSGVHPPEFWAEMWRSLRDGKAWRGQICNRAKDGSLFWLDSIFAPIVGADGRVDRYIGIANDITASKNAAADLANERQRLDNILRGTNVGTWDWNVRTGETRFNERWAEMVGYSLADLAPIGSDFWMRNIHPDDLARSAEALKRHFDGELEQYECEIRMRHRDGHWIWVLDRGRVSSRTPDGQPEWMHGTYQDITERHAAYEALRAATRAAEAASAAKSSFLANMSHEIRTPLNAVIGLTGLLENSRLDAEQSGFVRKIQLASRLLMGLINNVLDLAKIEAGETALDVRPFDLHDLIEGLAAVFGSQAQAKGLDFTVSLPPGLPRRLKGDALRLGQVLTNLLGNAIKFTERGSVALIVQSLGSDDPDQLSVRFAVKDTGIGIDPELHESLFQPFAQADVSTTRRYGGTGLGLSIVKHLTDLMGGRSGVTSQPSQGSEFWITLPLQRVSDEGRGGDSPEVLRLLLLEGNPPRRLGWLEPLAAAFGWRADVVDGVAAATQRLQPDAGGDGQPDIVLMAGGEALAPLGWQALLNTVAAIDAQRRPVTLRVGGPEDDSRSEEARQFDGLLPGPADAAALFNAVDAAVRRCGGDAAKVIQATRLQGAGVLWLSGVRVLVVDDSDINREVAARVLQREGAIATTAAAAVDALELLARSPGDFDIVLMDVQMPGMDGNEATRRMRTELGLTQIPVIALTAGALLAQRQRALDAGMDDFLSKPLDRDVLIRAVRRHVERARQAPLPVCMRTEGEPGSPQSPWPEILGIDESGLRERFGDDLALYRRVLRRLCEEFADLAAGDSVPVVPADRLSCAARMHKLYGSAGLLGAHVVATAAVAAEHALRADVSGAQRGAQAEPEAALDAVRIALKQLLQAAQAWLAEASDSPVEEPPSGCVEPVDSKALNELRSLLRSQDLAALGRCADLGPALRRSWGAERYALLQSAVERLEFRAALDLVARFEREPAAENVAD